MYLFIITTLATGLLGFISVVSAQANVFGKRLSKIGEIFDKLDEIKSQWVLCQG